MQNKEFSVQGYKYNTATPVKWLISHALQYKLFLICFILASIAMAFFASSIPTLIGRTISEVTSPGATKTALIQLTLFILVAILLKGIMHLSSYYSIEMIAARMERDTREDLYTNLLSKNQAFFNEQRVGNIMASATNDVQLLNGMMNPGVSEIFNTTLNIVMPLAFIVLIHPSLLLTQILFIVAFFLATKYYQNKLKPVSQDMTRSFGHMNADLNETVSGMMVVKTNSQEEQEAIKFVGNASKYKDAFIRQGKLQALFLPPLLFNVALAGGFLHGFLLFRSGSINIGELVSYMGLIGIMRAPFATFAIIASRIQLGLAAAERILQLIKADTAIDQNDAGRRAEMHGELEFLKVSFGHGDKIILRDISFKVQPGQTVAIVGQTGSGKTQLSKLINRIYEVRSGQVLIDGVDVREWNLTSLRTQISTIEQDISLFSKSVADNIGFGLGNRVDRKSIEEAASEAQAHSFIMRMPNQYDTKIGEKGVSLSGGERQRLAIARALLVDPKILILDDSTSAVDSITEEAIQEAIGRVMKGRTTVLITHRLSQIIRADLIVVLDGGTVIDQGTHEQLLGRCEIYQQLFIRARVSEGGQAV
ncbi:MAG: transporter related protein [Paenibacillus sp.]|nr:transporter related protein [Paenibacillus sp.]